jgi:DNA-binding IclR family transcriptional regulator
VSTEIDLFQSEINETPGANTLRRGLRLLMALRCNISKRLSDLARAGNLDKAATSPPLWSLTRYSFALNDASKRYRLGPAFAVLERMATRIKALQRLFKPL